MSFIPLVAAALAVVMVGIALAFSEYRGRWLRDRLAKLWSRRRREILHLEVDNGFFFFMELLLSYSQRLLWASAILTLLEALYALDSFPSAVILVACAFAWRAGVIWFIAHHRVKVFEGMLAFDGFGSYGQARRDWCSREKSARPLFIGAVGVVLAAIYILWANA